MRFVPSANLEAFVLARVVGVVIEHLEDGVEDDPVADARAVAAQRIVRVVLRPHTAAGTRIGPKAVRSAMMAAQAQVSPMSGVHCEVAGHGSDVRGRRTIRAGRRLVSTTIRSEAIWPCRGFALGPQTFPVREAVEPPLSARGATVDPQRHRPAGSP
jgi:hypothetical protein